MRRSRRASKNSIIQYEQLKAAAGGSGSGGGSHGSGSGRVKVFRKFPSPVADNSGINSTQVDINKPISDDLLNDK